MRWKGGWGWLRGPSAIAGDLPVRPSRGVMVADSAFASNAGKASTCVILVTDEVDLSVWAGTGATPQTGFSRNFFLFVMLMRVFVSRCAAYLSERPQAFVLSTSAQRSTKASQGWFIVETSTCVASVSDGVDSTIRAGAGTAPNPNTGAHCIAVHRRSKAHCICSSALVAASGPRWVAARRALEGFAHCLMRLAELMIGRQPRNIERRYLRPISRTRAEVVVQSALCARKVRLVRHGALCIGQRKVQSRVARQLQGLSKLIELFRLPDCCSYWLVCAI
jgi:hypothetical protein